jgi:hypothetical protein
MLSGYIKLLSGKSGRFENTRFVSSSSSSSSFFLWILMIRASFTNVGVSLCVLYDCMIVCTIISSYVGRPGDGIASTPRICGIIAVTPKKKAP